jgi:hypothetical protein
VPDEWRELQPVVADVVQLFEQAWAARAEPDGVLLKEARGRRELLVERKRNLAEPGVAADGRPGYCFRVGRVSQAARR